MIREFCAQNLEHVQEALRAGADRVELCDDLAVGGTTPSGAVMRAAVKLVHGCGGRVMVMIRPRGGNFAYDERELCVMEHSIGLARDAGADGVVFGCVCAGALDEDATRRLVRAAAGLDLTFHMAFDQIAPSMQSEALAALAGMGFSRVLTHGGSLDEPIARCLPHLLKLVHAAQGRMAIMPGGGVTWENADKICSELGVCEVHGTRIVRL